MAKLPNSQVVLRFKLGKGLVKARQRYSNTSRAILERVALQYAEDTYDEFRKNVQRQLEIDVRMELDHISGLFAKHIIGYSGRRSAPTGKLTTISKGGNPPSMMISTALPPWAPRNAEYLARKRNAVGHIRWFDNTGWRQNVPDMRFASARRAKVGDGPSDPGLLKATFARGGWESMFGPISVRFFRARKLSTEAVKGTISSKGSKLQIQIGNLQVRAIGKIEPHMLPGFTSGTVRATTTYNGRLMDVVAESDPRVAYRLGRMRNGIYRPTLEPFLGFFLTKSIPFAVERRIAKGGLGSILIR